MKHFFILLPPSAISRISELRENASNYYGSREYEEIKNVWETKPNIQADFNAALMLIGATMMAIAQCDSIYVAKGWEDDNYCKACHALAFSHGVDIVYEPV